MMYIPLLAFVAPALVGSLNSALYLVDMQTCLHELGQRVPKIAKNLQEPAALRPLADRIKDKSIIEPKTIFDWFDAYAHVLYISTASPRLPEPFVQAQLSAATAVHKTLLSEDTFAKLVNGTSQMVKTASAQELLQAEGAASLYARKKIIPQGSKLLFWGDLHGDIQALVLTLMHLYHTKIIDATLRVIAPNAYLVFGGDYVDRGQNGVEVVTLLSQLIVANADSERVICVRGNHEALSMNSEYGFSSEVARKYPGKTGKSISDIMPPYVEFISSLPAVLYVGVEHEGIVQYVQCCHGGFEMGWNPSELLAKESKEMTARIDGIDRMRSALQLVGPAPAGDSERYVATAERVLADLCGVVEDQLQNFLMDKMPNNANGFMWSDCAVPFVASNNWNAGSSVYNPARGLAYGARLIEKLPGIAEDKAASFRIVALLRAHQHNSTMPQLLCPVLGYNSGTCACRNQSLYVIYRQSHDGTTLTHPIPLVTTVATIQYTPSPSYISLVLSGDPQSWVLTNTFLPSFVQEVIKAKDGRGQAAFYNSLYESNEKWGAPKVGKLYAWNNECER